MFDAVRAIARNVVPPEVRKSRPYRRLAVAIKGLAPVDKLGSEMGYWQNRFDAESGQLDNKHYKTIFRSIAGEEDTSYVDGKVIADFGCGPRGSLLWAESARARIGIDVLADRYMDLGAREHDMVYVLSTENWIPLPTNYVDIMFTLNAMDHVENFDQMCREVIRVLKPGGTFIASFNLHEEPTATEPMMLTEALLDRKLLGHLDVERRMVAPRHEGEGSHYQHLIEGRTKTLAHDEVGYLWVRATKP